jgi:hypothetical protein
VRQTTFDLVLVVAEVLVVGKQDEEVGIPWLLVYFQQTLADVAKYYVPLVLESFVGTSHFQTSSRVAVVVIAEWIAAVGPAVVALRQDRNIRKGRQSWAEVVETMLLRR